MSTATAPASAPNPGEQEFCEGLYPHVVRAAKYNARKLRGVDPDDIGAIVMHEALLLFRKGEEIRDLKAWAETTVKHAMIDAGRSHSERNISLAPVHANTSYVEDDLSEAREALAFVLLAALSFDPLERELFREHALEGASSRELAERYGIPDRTISRKLKELREQLAASYASGELPQDVCEQLIAYAVAPDECEDRETIARLIDNHAGAAAICRDAASAYKGAAVCLPPAGLGEQHTGLLDRATSALSDLRDRAFGNAESAADTATTIATSGGARGAGGATGGGLLAAFAGGGAKVAAICAGGAATVACASAVGVLPAAVDPFKGGEPAQERAAEEALPSAAEAAFEEARQEAAIAAATDELAEANRENAAEAKAERKQERKAEARAEQRRQEARAERQAEQAAAETEEFSPLGTSSASTTPSSTGTVTETSDSSGTLEAGETKAPTPAQEEEFGRP